VAVRRSGDLEIEEDPVFERRSRRAERIGLALMVATVLAAAAGLLGSGPLSRGSVAAEALEVDFQRLSRYESSETLTLRIGATATRGPEVRVWVDRGYLDASRIEAVVPAPIRAEAGADRVVFVFAVAEPDRQLTVAFRLQPEHVGPILGQAGLEGPAARRPVAFRQFVFP
jgi:hypothetical protein